MSSLMKRIFLILLFLRGRVWKGGVGGVGGVGEPYCLPDVKDTGLMMTVNIWEG